MSNFKAWKVIAIKTSMVSAKSFANFWIFKDSLESNQYQTSILIRYPEIHDFNIKVDYIFQITNIGWWVKVVEVQFWRITFKSLWARKCFVVAES